MGRKKAATEPPVTTGPLFTAAYQGRCRRCGGRIEPGDQIGLVCGDLACGPCCTPASRAHP